MTEFFIENFEWGVEKEIEETLGGLKISCADGDSFDYEKFVAFVNRCNTLLAEMTFELSQWKMIFKKPQTLSVETLQKNQMARIQAADRKRTSVQEYLMMQYFIDKNVA